MKKMSNKKIVFGTLCVYVATIIIATIIFISLFRTSLLFSLDVFFYRGCVFLVFSALIAAGITLYATKLFKQLKMNFKDVAVVFLLFSGFTLGWFVLLPVTVERSISVFMLSYMEQNDQSSISADEFGDVFYAKYIEGFGAFDKRFAEQLLSGNIEETDDGNGYQITEGGRVIVNLFRLCADMFNTEKWLVYPNDYSLEKENKI